MTNRQPAEWAPHESLWTAWPSRGDLWLEDMVPAREEVGALIRAIDDAGRGEPVHVLAANEEAAADAERALAGTRSRVHRIPFGDIWLRDTAPIFVAGANGPLALDFGFNGWGGKYDLKHDDTVGAAITAATGLPGRRCDWIFEGGAIDVDGEGLGVTTEQCLLNPNRNPGLSREEIETRLRRDLGIERLLWLGDGLLNDHTDGHVDNLARFVAPGVLALPEASGADDPNADVFADARARAEAFGLKVELLPSPGLVERDGEIVPASYMNFYIGNSVVVVPLYGAANDAAAVDAVGRLFPGRRAVGLRADHILTGGGSFHCITQQLPKF